MARRIDHIIVAVADLDRAAAFYERLGFRLGLRNLHAWGLDNRMVNMRTSFIELVSLGADVSAIRPHMKRSFSIGAFLRSYLDRREGLAMVVLDSHDGKADAASFERERIGTYTPLDLFRKGRARDGSEVEFAFTLAFASAREAPLAGFFVCQHHTPELIWSTEYINHPNGAADLRNVMMSAPEPQSMSRFLESFTESQPARPSKLNLVFALSGATLDVATPDEARLRYGDVAEEADEPCFIGFAVAVPDLAAQAKRLDEEGIAYRRIGPRLVIPASAAFGAAIAFEAT